MPLLELRPGEMTLGGSFPGSRNLQVAQNVDADSAPHAPVKWDGYCFLCFSNIHIFAHIDLLRVYLPYFPNPAALASFSIAW